MKSSNTQNISVIFDWIQIEFLASAFSLDNIISNILFMRPELFIEVSGTLQYYKFTKFLTHSNIKLYFGKKEKSILLIMSGTALEWYRNHILASLDLSEIDFIRHLNTNFEHFKLRRIDIALDDFNSPTFYTPNLLLKYCQKKQFNYGKSTEYLPYGDEFVGQTLYLGKAGSNERIRIYDKRLEQAKKLKIPKNDIPPWIRTELSLRNEIAEAFVFELLERNLSLEKTLKGYLKEKVHFYEDPAFKKPLEQWIHFLKDAKAIKISIPKQKTEFEQKIHWFVHQGPAALMNTIKFMNENNLFLKNETEELALINNKKFTVELADILIERAVSLGKNDLIPIIKNNIKERGN